MYSAYNKLQLKGLSRVLLSNEHRASTEKILSGHGILKKEKEKCTP